MSEQAKVYIKSDYEKVCSVIADEAKNAAILDELHNTIRQLRAKSTFRLALLHQVREKIEKERANEFKDR